MELLIEDPHKHKEKEREKETKKKKKEKEIRKNREIHFFQISSSTFQDLLQDPI